MSNEESKPPVPPKPAAGTPTGSAPVPPKPAVKAAPSAAGKEAKVMPRRSFLNWMTLAWTAFTASMLAAGTATARFLFPNVLFEPPSTLKAGFPNEIQIGQVDERFKPKGIWLVRTAFDQWANGSGIFALSTVCTHLGCTPNWLEASRSLNVHVTAAGITKLV